MRVFIISRRIATILYFLVLSVALPLWLCADVNALSMSGITTSTNLERTKAGLPELIENEQLISSATAKAEDMCVDSYWAHTAPDGTTGWEFIKESGYKYKTAGENLAKGFVEDQAIVDAWMDSPKHRDNILQPKFNDIGVGSFVCINDTIVVSMYGREQNDKQTMLPDAAAQVKHSEQSIPQNNIVTRIIDEISRLIEQNYVLKRLLVVKHRTLV